MIHPQSRLSSLRKAGTHSSARVKGQVRWVVGSNLRMTTEGVERRARWIPAECRDDSRWVARSVQEPDLMLPLTSVSFPPTDRCLQAERPGTLAPGLLHSINPDLPHPMPGGHAIGRPTGCVLLVRAGCRPQENVTKCPGVPPVYPPSDAGCESSCRSATRPIPAGPPAASFEPTIDFGRWCQYIDTC